VLVRVAGSLTPVCHASRRAFARKLSRQSQTPLLYLNAIALEDRIRLRPADLAHYCSRDGRTVTNDSDGA